MPAQSWPSPATPSDPLPKDTLAVAIECVGAAGGWSGGGSRGEFARLLVQLQWVFIGLGIAGIVASIWVPIISTRHAVGSVAVGVGIALIRPFIIALYWPTIICLALAALAAIWPYGVAAFTWARARFTGTGPELTARWASIKSLWQPRAVALGHDPRDAGVPGVAGGAGPGAADRAVGS